MTERLPPNMRPGSNLSSYMNELNNPGMKGFIQDKIPEIDYNEIVKSMTPDERKMLIEFMEGLQRKKMQIEGIGNSYMNEIGKGIRGVTDFAQDSYDNVRPELKLLYDSIRTRMQ